jgi:hypothetical protein
MKLQDTGIHWFVSTLFCCVFYGGAVSPVVRDRDNTSYASRRLGAFHCHVKSRSRWLAGLVPLPCVLVDPGADLDPEEDRVPAGEFRHSIAGLKITTVRLTIRRLSAVSNRKIHLDCGLG